MTVKQLSKSRKTLTKRIDEHKAKIEEPKRFYPEWDSFSDVQKGGFVSHWKREIHAWETQIAQIDQELKRRCDDG